MTQIMVDVSTERWPYVMAEVAAAVGGEAAAVRKDVYDVIVREIPELREDQPLLALPYPPGPGEPRPARRREPP